jgi:hypothetical protein
MGKTKGTLRQHEEVQGGAKDRRNSRFSRVDAYYGKPRGTTGFDFLNRRSEVRVLSGPIQTEISRCRANSTELVGFRAVVLSLLTIG